MTMVAPKSSLECECETPILGDGPAFTTVICEHEIVGFVVDHHMFALLNGLYTNQKLNGDGSEGNRFR